VTQLLIQHSWNRCWQALFLTTSSLFPVFSLQITQISLFSKSSLLATVQVINGSESSWVFSLVISKNTLKMTELTKKREILCRSLNRLDKGYIELTHPLLQIISSYEIKSIMHPYRSITNKIGPPSIINSFCVILCILRSL